MKVTLAYPFEGHEPDATVDLPEQTAKQLIRDGAARLPDAPKRTPRSPNTEGHKATTNTQEA